MGNIMKVLAAAAVCGMIVLGGCAKKAAKIETAPPPPPKAVEQEAPKYTPTDEEVFKPIDMDAAAREILVTLYFDYDRYELRAESIEKLEKIAKFLAENKTMRVLIEGHADERGTSEYNMGLGENRSKAAREYLTTYGVESSRLEVTSYGRERPANPNCPDDPCHAKNRRVEWKVLSK